MAVWCTSVEWIWTGRERDSETFKTKEKVDAASEDFSVVSKVIWWGRWRTNSQNRTKTSLRDHRDRESTAYAAKGRGR